MQPLKKAPQNSNQPTSGDAGVLAESGVRAISKEARDALDKALGKTNTKPRTQPENGGVSYRRSVRTSTHEVCPGTLTTHMNLVHKVVSSIARRLPANIRREDLLAAGIFGLVDSLRKNGGDSGPTFEWYARIRIRGAVIDELRSQDRLSRRARDAINAASQNDDSEHDGPTFVSLDELSTREEEDFFAAIELDPAASYEAKEIVTMLADAFGKLTDREQRILGWYYFDELTFKEISAKIQLSETRVFQVHSQAINTLRTSIERRLRNTPLPPQPVAREDGDSQPARNTSPDVFVPEESPSNVA